MQTIVEVPRSDSPARRRAAEAVQGCLQACIECAWACIACAETCRNATDPRMLVHRIWLNLDCSEVCAWTATMLCRPWQTDAELVRRQAQLCARICAACADESERHANLDEDTRVAVEACRRCEAACHTLASVAAGEDGAGAWN